MFFGIRSLFQASSSLSSTVMISRFGPFNFFSFVFSFSVPFSMLSIETSCYSFRLTHFCQYCSKAVEKWLQSCRSYSTVRTFVISNVLSSLFSTHIGFFLWTYKKSNNMLLCFFTVWKTQCVFFGTFTLLLSVCAENCFRSAYACQNNKEKHV